MKSNNVSIPEVEVYRVKRVIDTNNNLKNRGEVLKMVSLLREEETVTESRVIQEEVSEENEPDIGYSLSELLTKLESPTI